MAGGWPWRARSFRRWGLPGAVSAVLAAIVMWLLLVELPRARENVNAAEQRWAQSSQTRSSAHRAPGPAAQDPSERFAANFPPALDRHRRIDRLLSMATIMGLQPRRIDVRVVPGEREGLMRVRVVMPLVGPYENLRRYIDLALREDHAIALDVLRIERPGPLQAELRAELQWSLWMQLPASPVTADTP